MSKSLYIATAEASSGKSIVSLGLMQAILGKVEKVAYFRPIISGERSGKKDNHINTIISQFDLDMSYDETFGFTRSEVVKLINDGAEHEVIDTLISKYKALEAKFDFILIEGTDFSGEGAFIEMDLNVLIAKNLGLPVLIVGSGKHKTLENYTSAIHLTYDAFKEKDVEVLAVIANKVLEHNMEMVREALENELPNDVIISVIPRIDELQRPTILEVADSLDAKILVGEDNLHRKTGAVSVGAMQLRNFLDHIHENGLVITPGDRADIILGTLQANLSSNYPKIGGIILTGGLLPDDNVMQLIQGLSQVVPILSVKEGTFKTANAVGNIDSQIYAGNEDKILKSIGVFEKHIDINALIDRFSSFENHSLTPSMFQYNMVSRAKIRRKHIVLPEGNDIRILDAAHRLMKMDIVDLSILGNQDEVKQLASSNGLEFDLSKVNIINPVESKHYDLYAETFFELRKHKNVNLAMAKDIMTDVSYFGTMMVYLGHADGMVSGAAHTTQHTIRPALQFVKTKPGVSVVSSVFFMCLPDRVAVFGDCAINPNPTAEQLAEIAISSADSSNAFGIEPKVAMLSYSSGSSGKGEDVDKVRKATEIVKAQRPDLKIEGPIQYDAAVDMNVGKSKLPDSDVAGQASVLIFPDLNTGNNTYKAVQRETGALAIGPMLQGLNAPVNDLSRGCTVEDIVNTVVITAIQAQED